MGRNPLGVVSVALLALAWILLSTPPASALVADLGLIGHWKLDSNANDSAGNNSGILVGHATWANDPQRGWCLDLDGNGSFVDVGDDPSLTFSDTMTVACWIQVRNFDRNWNAIFTKGDDWVLARTQADNRVAFLCLGLAGGGWPEVYSGDVNDGNWHHVAGVYDGTELALYLDGSRVDSKSLHGPINADWRRVLIGENGQAPNRFWNGLISDVRLYHRALTAEEIGVLAEVKLPAPPPPPPAPHDVTAAGHDSRIDLRWTFATDPNLEGYNIYRADSAQGPFAKLNASAHKASVCSDFFGVNDRTYYYCVKSVAIRGGGESEPSKVVAATSGAMTDEQLLTSVQEAAFRYFWDYGHPVSGLARADALHIALAAIHHVDLLLTWNCRHIDNPVTKPVVRSVCAVVGFPCPEICTPMQLWEAITDEEE